MQSLACIGAAPSGKGASYFEQEVQEITAHALDSSTQSIRLRS